MKTAGLFFLPSMKENRGRMGNSSFAKGIPFAVGESGTLPDYRNYRLTGKEWLLPGVCFCFLGAGLAWLFYRSLWGTLVLLPILPLVYQKEKKRRQTLRKRKLERQFCDGVRALGAALTAGYSVENAFAQAEKELVRIYGRQELLSVEFAVLRRRLHMGVAAEEALADLAERSGMEDIRELSQIFRIVRRRGGPLPEILRRTAVTIEAKVHLREEIRTLMTEQRLEFFVMSLMPPAMLIFVGTGNPGFLDCLYEGLPGRVFMTGCLLVYGLSLWIGDRILAWEV